MENTIGFKRKSERELEQYQAELEWFIDSLYELLSIQEPKVWYSIINTIADILNSWKDG